MPKVLIVEDDPFLRGVYEKILIKEGFETEVAVDGKDGFAKAQANEPDLIILDMLMPEMNGIEFLEAYDLKNTHPNVKVIVLSNMMIQDQVNRAIELGASNYKTKALFSPREMMELIRGTLNPSQS